MKEGKIKTRIDREGLAVAKRESAVGNFGRSIGQSARNGEITSEGASAIIDIGNTRLVFSQRVATGESFQVVYSEGPRTVFTAGKDENGLPGIKATEKMSKGGVEEVIGERDLSDDQMRAIVEVVESPLVNFGLLRYLAPKPELKI